MSRSNPALCSLTRVRTFELPVMSALTQPASCTAMSASATPGTGVQAFAGVEYHSCESSLKRRVSGPAKLTGSPAPCRISSRICQSTLP